MIMGANIGTSMTSTLVSLTHMGDKDQVNVSTITNYCIFIQLYIVLLISISRFSHFYLSVRKGLFCCNCPWLFQLARCYYAFGYWGNNDVVCCDNIILSSKELESFLTGSYFLLRLWPDSCINLQVIWLKIFQRPARERKQKSTFLRP